MSAMNKVFGRPAKRIGTVALSAILACSLSFPSLAFAEVRINDFVVNEGENAIGGGTATLTEQDLNLVDVVVDDNGLVTDQDLNIYFNGGNELEWVAAYGDANVTARFRGANCIDEFVTVDNANMTVYANGNSELEEIHAYDNSNMTIDVTGENDFEEIVGLDNANITIRGADCQKRDKINIEGGDTAIVTVWNGDLTIDHATVNLDGEERNLLGSVNGSAIVNTSKIEADDDAATTMMAKGTMLIRESVIEIAGTVFSGGLMTINHSDVEVGKPEGDDDGRYRVFSYEGIKLIDEENGEVREGEIDDEKVWYVDTDDNDGSDVDLKADGDPEYYTCRSSEKVASALPKTGDEAYPFMAIAAGIVSAALAGFALKQREER